jgi:hypothetical protein
MRAFIAAALAAVASADWQIVAPNVATICTGIACTDSV